MFSREKELSTFIVHEWEFSMTKKLIRQQKWDHVLACINLKSPTYVTSLAPITYKKTHLLQLQCSFPSKLLPLHPAFCNVIWYVSATSRWVEEQSMLEKIAGGNSISQSSLFLNGKRREGDKLGISLQGKLKYFLITNINYKCLF